ncbi:hypothetical protein PF002_g32799, partial [Phytophthora fragariae]
MVAEKLMAASVGDFQNEATRKRKASTCSLSYKNTSDDNPSTSGELRDGPHHDLIDGDPTGCQEELTDNHQNAEAEPNSVNEGPPLKSKSFVSWNEFHAYLDTYQAQTYQMFRVRSNKSVAARNQIISRDKSKENTLGAVRESALVSRHAHWTAKH